MFSSALMKRAGALAIAAALLPLSAAVAPSPSFAETQTFSKQGDPTPVKDEDGKYFDKNGAPTYKIQPDGTVDWFTYSGYRRYHAECHVCHGPDGMGSTYAPALIDSLKTLDFDHFQEVVVGGRQNVGGGNEKVMPSFGLNKNVMCYLDDIYVYLRARSDGALGRARPAKRENKSPATAEAEKACLGE
ncbi:c-type cytochrome, methanol metabolism-related [Xanthobacter sp. V13C-7B]